MTLYPVAQPKLAGEEKACFSGSRKWKQIFFLHSIGLPHYYVTLFLDATLYTLMSPLIIYCCNHHWQIIFLSP
jgi:hypothetical protein